jgi:hypothetical protein
MIGTALRLSRRLQRPGVADSAGAQAARCTLSSGHWGEPNACPAVRGLQVATWPFPETNFDSSVKRPISALRCISKSLRRT